MKILLKQLSLMILFCVVFASKPAVAGSAGKNTPDGGRIAGNGGGIVIRGDKYITIGSAQIPIHRAQGVEELSGLSDAVDGISKLDISSEVKNALMAGLAITSDRQYFWIDDLKSLDSKTYQRLLREYGEVKKQLGLPKGDQMAIVAITSQSKTFLVRHIFDNLVDDQARAAILFHEGLRVVFPQLSTESVVRLETAFEDFIRDKNDVRIYYEIATLIHPFDDLPLIKAYLTHDLKKGLLKNIVQVDEMGIPHCSLLTLLGDGLPTSNLGTDIGNFLTQSDHTFMMGEFTLIMSFDPIKWRSRLSELRNSTSGSASNKDSLFLAFLIQNFGTIRPVVDLNVIQMNQGTVYSFEIDQSASIQLFPKNDFSLSISSKINYPQNGSFSVLYSDRGFEGKSIGVWLSIETYKISLLMPRPQFYSEAGHFNRESDGVPYDISAGFLLNPDTVDSIINSQR